MNLFSNQSFSQCRGVNDCYGLGFIGIVLIVRKYYRSFDFLSQRIILSKFDFSEKFYHKQEESLKKIQFYDVKSLNLEVQFRIRNDKILRISGRITFLYNQIYSDKTHLLSDYLYEYTVQTEGQQKISIGELFIRMILQKR